MVRLHPDFGRIHQNVYGARTYVSILQFDFDLTCHKGYFSFRKRIQFSRSTTTRSCHTNTAISPVTPICFVIATRSIFSRDARLINRSNFQCLKALAYGTSTSANDFRRHHGLFFLFFYVFLIFYAIISLYNIHFFFHFIQMCISFCL